MPTVTKYGDWNKFGMFMRTVDGRINTGLRNASAQVGMVYAAAIKKGIRSQAPSGKRFSGLHPFTIAQKGSSKALVDRATLLNSITWKHMGPLVVFIGVLRKARNKDGQPLINIAAMMEEGATIAVTDKMRAYLASEGLYLRADTVALEIPPRPFIEPVFKSTKVKAEARLRMQAAMSEVLVA